MCQYSGLNIFYVLCNPNIHHQYLKLGHIVDFNSFLSILILRPKYSFHNVTQIKQTTVSTETVQ